MINRVIETRREVIAKLKSILEEIGVDRIGSYKVTGGRESDILRSELS